MNRDRSKSKSSRFTNVECYHCGKKGHIKKHCRKLKRENKNDKGKEKEKGDGNDDKVTTITDDFLILCDSYDVVNLACHETSWVIDSGASVHATCHNGFPPRLGRPQKYGVAIDLFCTGVIGHPGHMFLN